MLTLQTLPVIIFLFSIIAVLFHWGVVQFFIRKIAWVMQVTMATTPAESLNAAGNIFLSLVCDVSGLMQGLEVSDSTFRLRFNFLILTLYKSTYLLTTYLINYMCLGLEAYFQCLDLEP